MREASIDRVVASWGEKTRGGLAVILKEQDGKRSVPIFIGTPEGHALLLGLQGLKLQRPMTHDLVDTLVRAMGGKVESVVVSALEANVYYATLRIAIGKKTVEIDCRPSDGMNLAARSSSPLYVDESVLDAAGKTDLSGHAPFSVLWPVTE